MHDALYASKIISYAQGLDLMRAMGEKKDWALDLGGIAASGAAAASSARASSTASPRPTGATRGLTNLMLDSVLQGPAQRTQQTWREVVALARRQRHPGARVQRLARLLRQLLRCERLPANLLQAQRDFFGAHTYERIDKPAGQMFHTEWPEIVD